MTGVATIDSVQGNSYRHHRYGLSGRRLLDHHGVTALSTIDIIGRHDDVIGTAGKILQGNPLRCTVGYLDAIGVAAGLVSIVDMVTINIRQ